MRYIQITFLLLFFVANSFSQTMVGEWQEHFSYNNAKHIVIGDNKMVCLTTGGLFCYRSDYNEITKLNKSKGLFGGEITAIQFNSTTNEFYIGYKSGMIDILKNDKIKHVDNFYKSNQDIVKNIYHFEIQGKKVYVSTSSGVLIYNSETAEFTDIIKFSINGKDSEIYKTEFFANLIIVSSSEGLFYVNKDNSNINDFAFWKKIIGLPLSDDPVLVQSYNNELFIGINSNSQSYIYKWDQSDLNLIATYSDNLNSINLLGNDVVACFNKKLIKINNQVSEYYSNVNLNINSVQYINSNSFAIADSSKSMIIVDNGNVEKIVPNGPEITPQGEGVYANNKIYFIPENPILQSQPAFLFAFDGQSWANTCFDGVSNISKIAISEKYQNNIFVSAWNDGIYKITDNQITAHYTPDNSSLENSSGGDCKIVDMKPDLDGNIWIASKGSSKQLNVLSQNGESVAIDISSILGNSIINKITISESTGFVILNMVSNNNIIVYDCNKTPFNIKDDRAKLIPLLDYNNSIIYKYIYSVAEDNDGKIWFGTQSGVLFANSIKDVFTKSLNATAPIVNSDYLLKSSKIHDIDIDQANCKWFSTNNYGVYKFSPEGNVLVKNFNTENSPLPSNVIYNVSINKSSGNVFMSTDKGLVSYRDATTQAADDYSSMYVYPNPVRPDYSGQIVVKGLIQDSLIKITDANGNVVYESYSTGGQMVWDGNDMNGNKVRSGVYLIFASGEIGQKSNVVKLLIIR